jgi:hypothetical protein
MTRFLVFALPIILAGQALSLQVAEARGADLRDLQNSNFRDRFKR